MSSSTGTLPAIRRVVIGHQPDGSPSVVDDTVQPISVPGDFRVAQLFVQDEYEVSDPISAIAGAQAPSAGMVKPGGLVFKSVDIPPHTETLAHYTDTIDHLIFTHGTFELVLHDGSKRIVKPGDVVTQLAGIHQWNNIGDDWARFIGVSLPAKPVVVDGKTLNQGPLKGLKF